MLAKVITCTVIGVDGHPVDVEVDVAKGLPTFSIVGLPDNAVRESRDRVKAAIKNCGYEFPNRRITVNLAPADLKKEGTGFDLPIAIGILAAIEIVSPAHIENTMFTGELALDGKIRPIKGVIPITIAGKATGCSRVVIPEQNEMEAALIGAEVDIIAIKSLPELVEYLSGRISIAPLSLPSKSNLIEKYHVDFSEVKGQLFAKRGLEIAAAGGHNVFMLWSITPNEQA